MRPPVCPPAQTQRLVAEFTEHSSVLQSFSFNADKTLLITASADNTAKVCAHQQCGTLPTVSDYPPFLSSAALPHCVRAVLAHSIS